MKYHYLENILLNNCYAMLDCLNISESLVYSLCTSVLFKMKELQIRKFSPVLEGMLLSGNGSLTSSEWKTVPDIWKMAAEKFGNSVALVDPYHNPPTNMSYKQVSSLSFGHICMISYHFTDN